MSERFDRAMIFVIDNEGGFTVDHAGPTKYGVTLSTLRKTAELIEGEHPGFGDFDKDGDIDIDDVRKMEIEQARVVYKTQWWDRYQYERFEDFRIAQKVFDLSINMGPSAAHRLLQQAVNKLYGPILDVDGFLGDKTFAQVNRCYPEQIVTELKAQAWRYYQKIIAKNKNFEKFRSGWRNRAYK